MNDSRNFYRQSSFVADRNAPVESQGDCWPTCVAILLGLGEEVRDKLHRAIATEARIESGWWFNQTIGFVLWETKGHYTLGRNEPGTEIDNTAGDLVVANGPSPRGDFDHSILVDRVTREMVWDPHPSDAGLASDPNEINYLHWLGGSQ